jgi:NADP-dependent aldehyde dehydrogenase
LIFGAGNEVGQALVADPRIKAVGFTGSRSGGLALISTAQQRPEPIPVYAEMSSVNPVFVLPAALAADPVALAAAYVGSLTLGSGQFCTNPGVVFVPNGDQCDVFIKAAGERVAAAVGQPMLTEAIADAFANGTERLLATPGVALVARGEPNDKRNAPAPVLVSASAEVYATTESLRDEVFGAAGLVIRYDGIADLVAAAERLDGQLTATIHCLESDAVQARALLPVLERKVGRIIFNGWPTGVEVGHAMVHGGPFPSTSDSRTTSVGSLAIERFQRPVAYQDVPAGLLPEALRDDNPWMLTRRMDGAIDVPSKAGELSSHRVRP